MSDLTGGCYCGAIHFRLQGSTTWCGHCHCTICQRIHGAGVVTWVGCQESAVEITVKNSELHWYSSTPEGKRGSCSACGSQLFFKSPHWPDELHITRTSFAGEIDRQPEGHANYNDHVTWLSLRDNLPA